MKKILITFILSFVGFISFCSAGLNEIEHITVNGKADTNYINNSADMVCVKISGQCTFYFNFNHSANAYTYISTSASIGDYEGLCSEGGQIYYQSVSDSCVLDFYSYTYDNYTSQQCQSEYNLIPIESVDTNYCVSNSLCPSSDCPIYTGDSNWSSLYINDIQHEGAGTINITIPEEFNRDYTNENDVFDLNVEGYNVDTEYIDGIIRTQNYKPTSEDFTRLVGMLAPYSKYLIFLLFMFIIWAWIKKPFKSKKL